MPINSTEARHFDGPQASIDFPIRYAVELLDRLTIRRAAERELLVRGAIALALQLATHPDVDAGKVLVDLEQLLLGKGSLNGESLDRMLHVVAQLRPLAGLH